MALVLVQEIRDLAAVLFHSIDDLLGLADGHAGVVLAVDDHEWGCNFPGLVDGAYVLEELTVLLQRAVLGLSQGATIGARVLQEGNEVGDPHDIHPRAPEFRVFGESGEHHEPAVGASHYRDTLVAAPSASAPRMPGPRRSPSSVLRRRGGCKPCRIPSIHGRSGRTRRSPCRADTASRGRKRDATGSRARRGRSLLRVRSLSRAGRRGPVSCDRRSWYSARPAACGSCGAGCLPSRSG